MSQAISLRAMRVNRGISADQLAEKCGVNRTTITDWERGFRFPNVPKILKLEAALNCRFDDIRWNVAAN